MKLKKIASRLQNLSIWQRVVLFALQAFILMVVMAYSNIPQLKEMVEVFRQYVYHPSITMTTTKELKFLAVYRGRLVRDVVLTGDTRERGLLLQKLRLNDERFADGITALQSSYLGDKGDIDRARSLYRDMVTQHVKSMALDREGKQEEATRLLFARAGSPFDLLIDQLGIISAFAERKSAGMSGRAEDIYRHFFVESFWYGALGALLLALLSIPFTRSIVRPLDRIRRSIIDIAEGRLEEEAPFLDLKNELGDIGRSLEALRHVSRRQEQDLVTKGEVAELHQALQSAESFESFAETLLARLALRMELVFGACFLADSAQSMLMRIGGYACSGDTHGGRFAFGEGVVGQAAADKRRISLRLAAEGEGGPVSTCGLGSFRVDSLLVIPLVHNGLVLGVLELGSLQPPAPEHEAFLDALLPMVSMNLEILSKSLETRKLLETSRSQAHLLEQQTVELEMQKDYLLEQREELERSQEELARSEERSRLILASIREGLLGLDMNGHAMFLNHAAAEMLGYPESEISGISMHELVHHPGADGCEYPPDTCPIHLTTRDGVSRTIDSELFWRKDGSSFPVEYTTTPMEKEGAAIGVVVTFRDITERKAAALALAEERERLQSILDNSPLGIVFTTGDRILFANPRFVETYGIGVGAEMPNLYVNRSDRDEFLATIESGKPLLDREVRLFDRNGQVRDVFISTLPTSYHGEKGLLGWIIDVTERVQNRQRLESVLKVTQMNTESIPQLLHAALAEALVVTASKIGCIYNYCEETRRFTLNACSREVVRECSAANKLNISPFDDTGLWGEAVRQRKPVIRNSFDTEEMHCPVGDVPLTSFMAVPVISAGRVVAVVGVSNKGEDYTDTDALQLTLLMDAVWRVVEHNEHVQALREINLHAETALDLTKSGYWKFDFRDPHHLVRSDRNIELHGLPPMPGNRYPLDQSWLDQIKAVDPQVAAGAGELYTGIVNGALSQYEYTYCYQRPVDGKVIWVHSKGTIERDEAGAPRYMFGVAQDVTEFKLAEQRLQQVNFLNDQALGLTKAGYWHVPLDGSGWYNSSPRAVAIFGDIPNDDCRYRVMEEWFANVEAGDPEAARVTLDSFQGTIEGRYPVYDSIYAYKRPVDGRVVWIHAYGSVVYEGDGKPTDMYGVTQDVTEIMLAEKEMLHAKQLAEEASRSKADFLSNMSHEIRTPMNAIIGMSHLALKTELTTRQRNYLEKIRISGQHLLGIINDILDISKIEAGKLDLERTGFPVAQIIGKVSDLLGAKASEKGLKLEFDVDPRVPARLVGDPLRLGQVLLNYAANAVKFSAAGSIVIGVGMVDETPLDLAVRFSVKDSGIGLTEEQKGRLFQDFQQADSSTTRKFGGTGLGLSICKRLVDLMGGELGVDSFYGEGSTFWFTVRLAKVEPREHLPAPGALSVPPVPACSAAGSLKGGVVLLVEDNEINREVALEILAEAGLEVDIAENGEQALEKVAARDYDAVLMDMQMPVMDGLQATRLIREQARHASLPIIAMTANAMAGDRDRCLAAGMNDHIAKPIDPERLFALLERWVKPRGGTSFQEPRTSPSGAEADAPIPQLPGVDAEPAIARLLGRRDLYLEVLQKFALHHRETSQRLAELIGAGDWNGAEIMAHSMKGLAGIIGATRLEASARELESRLGKKGGAGLGEELKAFSAAHRTLLAALDRVFPPRVETGAQVDLARGGEVCERLTRLLANDDSAASDLFEEHTSLLQAVLGELRFKSLEQAVRRYDFERALQVMQSKAVDRA